MTLDCNKYKKTLDNLSHAFARLKEQGKDFSDIASAISNSSGVHIIAVYRYMALPHMFGAQEAIDTALKSCEDFYKVEVVDFKPEEP